MRTRNYPLIAVVLTLIAFAGCITTATVIVTAKLAPSPDGSPIEVTDAAGEYINGKIVVNLNGDEDFEEYKDNIKNIDNVGFYLEVSNYTFSDQTFQLFLEPDILKDWTTPHMPADSGSLLLFTGLTVPGRPQQSLTSKVTVKWEESLEYFTGLDDVKKYLERGVFSLYPNTTDRENFRLTIDSLVIIVTLSGKK